MKKPCTGNQLTCPRKFACVECGLGYKSEFHIWQRREKYQKEYHFVKYTGKYPRDTRTNDEKIMAYFS